MEEAKTKRELSDLQKLAVDAPDKTLVVSAGAGSGKTTVLTERLLRRLIEGADITNILVVTFLRSAAASLKSKLYDALLGYCAEHPENAAVARNLYLIPSARISTVDSFCFDLVRDNFSALSLPPSLRIVDECENGMLLDSCLDRIIEKKLASDDADTIMLCDNSGGIDAFKKTVCGVLGKYRALPFWRDAVKTRTARLNADAEKAEKGFMKSECGKKIAAVIRERLENEKRHVAELRAECDVCLSSEKEYAQIDSVGSFISDALELIGKGASYTDLYTLFADLSFVRKPTFADKAFSEYYSDFMDKIKGRLTKCRRILARDEDAETALYKEMARVVTALNGFVLELERDYYETKVARGALDFADIEQLALELLGNNFPEGVARTPLCRELQNGIEELYIDEYQDINPLQDTLFRLLSRGDNRFMVGDIKQSIYRFRNSSSDIFLGYINSFADLSEKKENARVFLNENYRSSKPIIDFVNLLFGELYNENTVGASYENEKIAYPSRSRNKCAFPVEIDMFSGGNAAEKEAAYTASVIRSLVDGGNCKYGDIAVIMRSAKENGVIYRRAFDALGIPYASDKKENFLAFPEIELALAILRSVDDPLDDISLASALRSPVFCFDAEDLYSVKRYYAYESLYACVRRAASSFTRGEAGGKIYRAAKKLCEYPRRRGIFPYHALRKGERPTAETRRKCRDAVALLLSLRRSGAECSAGGMIRLMYQKTRLISLCAAEKNGEKRVAHLNTLYKFALDYEKTSFRGITEFLAYLEKAASGGDFGFDPDQDENELVKILTVHQSKGLEYPVCFVSATGRNFNIQDLKGKYLISGEGDLSVKLTHGIVGVRPAAMTAEIEAERKRILRDELYCLYVALTRAKERLYITGTLGDPGPKGFFECTSSMEWIHSALDGKNAPFFVTKEDPVPLACTAAASLRAEEKIGAEVFRKALGFEYPFPGSSAVPAKAAVSELRKGIFEDDEYTRTIAASEATKEPSFVCDSADAASVGTSTHLFMQFADFGKAISNGVRAEAERLVGDGMISRADADRIDIPALERFFASGLCRAIMDSPFVMREKRFNLIEDSAMLSYESGESVMIQGVIDCFFKNTDGTLTVVDYKTDRVPRSEGDRILTDRHGFQIRYYCRAAERMTGAKVSKAVLYSFAMGREVEVRYEG